MSRAASGTRVRRSRLPVLVVVVGLLVVDAAACSSSSEPALGKDPLGTVLAATRRAGSGQIRGAVAVAGRSATGPVSGVWQGDLDGTGDVHVAFTRSSGDPVDAELRWIHGTFYYRRSVANLPAGDSLALFTRSSTALPWRKATLNGGVGDAVPAPFSPVALLRWLQQLHMPMSVHAHDRIGSRSETRLEATRPLFLGVWPGATVDLWIDGRNRVTDVRVRTSGGSLQYAVSDFGTAAHVTAPPASDISTADERPVVEPSGPFTTVRSGVSGRVHWSLRRAPGTQGTVCWRWDATPPLAQSHLGAGAARCLEPAPTHPVDPSDAVQFAVVGNGTSSYDALVALLPPKVKQLTLGFVGGATRALPVQSPLVWIGPTLPTKAYLGVTLEHGTLLGCGAGAITDVGDLHDPQLTTGVATAAWACLPAG